ncbi:non-ribosomal peptide synthetase [Cellulomonas chitinilytica]|uniref:Non-ribosomal peptide synthetase n=1 Tax=Cellulomonas chitinilytica TaxID=398759 RepID=A0A919P3V0_9CELL|nr:non-ribosomal peptide synthetase [Cellulomonas chitinilytica]GIG20914.1 non-ribosomal peptide synthetase [Cellulomonas chitinilytica]
MTGSSAAERISAERQALLARRINGAARSQHVAIPRRAPGADVPLSSQQQRLWFLDQLVPHSAFANIDVALRLEFAVDAAVLQRALDEVVRRHESLRTTIRPVDGSAVQVVAEHLHVPLVVVPLTGTTAEVQAAVTRTVTEEARRPFDLATGPLVRATLLREQAARSVLVVTVHHIVADGWSMRTFFSELAALYTAFGAGRPSPLPELTLQYPDYAVWQRAQLDGASFDRALAAWQRRLEGAPVLEAPTDRPRPAMQTFTGATLTFTLPAAPLDRLRDLAGNAGATPFMGLLAVFGALLARWTGQDDLVVGSYVAGRTRVELEPLIGFFVNTLPLRVRLDGDPTFREALLAVREVTLDALDHQEVPFEKLVEVLAPPRDLSRNPLCQVAFQLVTAPAGTRTGPTPSTVEAERGTASFDMVWSATLDEPGGEVGAHGTLEYDTALFDRATVERLVERFTVLLDRGTAAPDVALSRLDLTTEAERALVDGWNATAADVPEDGLATLFTRQVASTPSATAVVAADGTRWTYTDLDRRARVVAARLAAAGVGPGTVVGVLLDRSPELVATAVALQLLGATYLPLDPAYPADRRALMTQTAGATLVVGGPDAPVDVLSADADTPPWDGTPAEGVDPAYVLFTSGSTGRPKGVAGTHRQVLNRLHWMWRTYPFGPEEVAALRTPTGFVDSLWEIWGALLQGVPTVVVAPDVKADTDRLVDVLERHRVTRLWLVPSFLRTLLTTHPDLARRLPDLRMWVASGEPLAAELADRFHAAMPGAELHNCYGTSEVWDATWHVCRPAEPVVPLGRPIANVRCHVLDPHGVPTGVGMPGELCVAGAGLTAGYLGDASLTEGRFVTHAGEQVYRTGDRARWLPTGELEFLGRLDDQIKVRGVRLEPGDVEAALAELPGVVDVAVAAPGGDGGLTAYLVTGDGPRPTLLDVRRHLAQRVPEPAIPTRLTFLPALPHTSSGKLDRRALPAPEAVGTGGSQPRTPVERLVLAVWVDVLDTPGAGVDDNFFELGGHSLLATQIVSRLRQLLDVDLPLQRFFEAPTAASLAAVIVEEGDPVRVERVAELAVGLLSMTDDEVAAALEEDAS